MSLDLRYFSSMSSLLLVTATVAIAQPSCGGGAIADYTRAIEIDPVLTSSFNGRGNARAAQGNVEEAIADFSRAIELNPDYALAYGNRGVAYQGLQRYRESLSDLNRAIELGLEEAIPTRDEVLCRLQ